uniref:RNase H type-1 domain-containing protein n=1 Tax=Cannabis sativa TaxID=3483 RepID=A0A803PTC7_CANSA
MGTRHPFGLTLGSLGTTPNWPHLGMPLMVLAWLATLSSTTIGTRIWYEAGSVLRMLEGYITLPSRPKEDGWLWLPAPNGHVSVKLAYRVVKNLQGNLDSDSKWRFVWGAKMHNRLKFFWWKILSYNLLTKERLITIFPGMDTLCPMCSLAIESSLHLFWECEYARAIWFGCSWQMRTSTTSFSSWDDWLKWFSIPQNRLGWIMCNSDISIGKTQSAGAVIFRQEDNKIVKIVTFLSNYCDPLPGELQAICEGAASARLLGYKNVIFFSDSAAAVDSIRNARSNLSKLHHNLRDLITNLVEAASALSNWETHWTPRQHNGVAHALARWANRNNHFGVFDLADFDGSL